MWKNISSILISLIIITSCEEVIEIDLNNAKPEIVVEAIVCKDSTVIVNLTRSSNFFSSDVQENITDAQITVSDGIISEELYYNGSGAYTGNTIVGTEGRTYEIDVLHNGINYTGSSFMPVETTIISVSYNISDAQSHLNPYGDRVVSVKCTFSDVVEIDNFYLVRFSDEHGNLIERYYLLTESQSNSGTIDYEDGNISFYESLFYEGNYIDVKIFSVDEPVYNYFLQLTDILFWKRRIMPPTPYNPQSNISNGALGYFAAWSFDSEILILE